MALKLLKRTLTASIFAVGLVAAPLTGLVPVLAPLAHAQDQSAEDQFKALLAMQGLPETMVKWTSVETSPTGLIVHGLYADLTAYKVGFDTLPLGDLDLSEIQTQDNKYITHLKARFSNISVDMANLMATGQKMGQAPASTPGKPNPAAQIGMGLAMGSGYIQGLGYKTLTVTMGFEEAVDLSSGKATISTDFDIADAFKLDVGYDMVGVDAAYLDWAKANAAKMYLDHSPTAAADIKKDMEDPSSPVAKVGFARYSMEFTDQGLMPKIEPQLAALRQNLLGTNPDGTPAVTVSEDKINQATQSMATAMKLAPEKVEPLVRAAYNFVVTPKHIAMTVKFDPAFTLGELSALNKPAATGTPPAPAIDWNSRLSIEASN